MVAAARTAWSRRARTAGPRSRFDLMAVNGWLSPIFPAGFYYKTFKWPAPFWTPVLRAADPPRRGPGRGAARRPIPTATTSATPIATCWWSAAARPGSPPRSPPAAAGARVMLADEQTRFGGRLLAERLEIDGRAGAGLGRGDAGRAREPARGHAAAAHHGVRLLRPQSGRAGRGGGADARRSAAAPAPLDGAGAGGRAGDRRDRAAAGVRRQRPAGRDAGGRGPHLPQPLRRGAGRAGRSCSRPATTPIGPRSIWRRPASRSPRWSTRARRAGSPARRRRCAPPGSRS